MMCDMMLRMNEEIRKTAADIILAGIHWGVCYLTVYSVMIIVAGMAVGVGNGYILLVAGMVWLGSLCAHILMHAVNRTVDFQKRWIAESVLKTLFMAILNPVCGIASALLAIVEYGVRRKAKNRIVIYGAALLSMVCMFHLIWMELQGASSCAAGLSLLIMQAFGTKESVRNNTAKMEDEKKNAKTIYLTAEFLQSVCMTALFIIAMRYGLYAYQQKALFVFLSSDLCIGGIMALICAFEEVKQRSGYSIDNNNEITAVLSFAAVISIWMLGIYQQAALFSMGCVVILYVVLFLLKRADMLKGRVMKIMLSIWVMIYFISMVLLVYHGYDGMNINVICLGETAGACALVYLFGTEA